MIDASDIATLEKWAMEGDAPEVVRAWHAQLIFELVQYIRYLEKELSDTRLQNADLDEKIRLGT
jgi:hypothetical protein